MKKQIINLALMLMSITLFFGCNEVAQVTEEPEIDWSQSYLPLQVGNEWHYELVSRDTVNTRGFVIVRGSKYIHKNLFYEVFTNIEGFYATHLQSQKIINEVDGGYTFYISSSDGEKYYVFDQGNIILYRDLIVEKLECAQNGVERTTVETERYVFSTKLADLDVSALEYNLLCNTSEPYRNIYFSGVGCIITGFGRHTYKLTFAKVNGKEFGEKLE